LQNIKNSKRFSWIDIAKGIAINLVVYRHLLIGIERSGLKIEPYLLQMNEMVYSFRMPLFFILSGFFFSRSMAKRNNKEFVKYKISSLIYPYLVWCLIHITLQIIMSDYTNASRGLEDYLYILIKPRAIDHLWFLFALFNVTITIFILRYLIKINKRAVFAISLVAVYLSTLIKDVEPFQDILFYMPYFALGDLISEKALTKEFQVKISSNAGLLLMLPLFVVSQWYWLNHHDINIFGFGAVATLGSFFIIAISVRIAEQRWTGLLALIGRKSLEVYLAHVVFSSAFRIFFINVLHINNIYLLLFLCMTLGVIFPILLAAWGERFAPVSWLFLPPGKKRLPVKLNFNPKN
jgi:fucose 4-O-acetylase-like acetyltransferase